MPWCAQFNGRAGREGRKALPVLRRFANPPGSAHPFGDECADSLNESEHITMATRTQGASAQSYTAKHPFNRCNHAGHLLFEVRAGVPAIDALETASCFMTSARDIAAEVAGNAEGENPNHYWGAFYLIEMAKAVLDSAISAMHEERRASASQGGRHAA